MINKQEKFAIPVTIYWENTDAGGIVYHSQYVNFAERARSEWIRHKTGKKQSQLMKENKIGFVVKLIEIDYLAPAYLDDELMVSCNLVNTGKTSMDFKQDVYRKYDEKKLVQIKVKAVSIDDSFKPVKLPTEIL